MPISSINIQTAKASSKAHMNRDEDHKITYLLDPSSTENTYKSFLDAEEYLDAAKIAAKKITGRKMQQKAIDNFTQEALINLENYHNIADVEKVFIELKKEYGGFEIFDIAIHHDEGYFYHREEELEYRPNRDIFFNNSDEKFYLDSKLTKEADLSQFDKRYNIHAHVRFSKFDMTTGKNPRLQKSDMSKIQTLTAKSLKMQRGELWSKAKRMSHWQLKNGYDLKRDEKKNKNQTLADKNILTAEIKKLRAKLQELGAVRTDYAKLEAENKDLKKLVQQKNLTIEELEKRIAELLSNFKSKDEEFVEKDDKNALKSVFEEINKQNEEDEPFETHKLEQDAKQNENHASAKIFKQVYETRGTKSQRTEKINWFEEEVIPTVTFDIRDLEELYSELQNHDEKRTLHFQKAMNLFRRAEKSLQIIFNFVKEKFTHKKIVPKNKAVEEKTVKAPEQSKADTELEKIEQRLKNFINEDEQDLRKGFRR